MQDESRQPGNSSSRVDRRRCLYQRLLCHSISLLRKTPRSSLDSLRRASRLPFALTTLDLHSFKEQVHEKRFNVRLGTRALGSLHQWVSNELIVQRKDRYNVTYRYRLGGLILNEVVNKFTGFVVFQPIINGIGGNLVSVQASRISTMLHQTSILGILPPHAKLWVAPWTALFKGAPYAKTARILIGMALSGQLVFVFAADYIKCQRSTVDAYFVLSYLVVSALQVILLLYAAHIIIHAMWRHKIDPDNSAIPYLTALGDLTGTMFLALAFWFLTEINQEYRSCEQLDAVVNTTSIPS